MGDELIGYQVVLFGSRAAGNAHERSDLDIGIIGKKPLPIKTFYKMEDLFEQIAALLQVDEARIRAEFEARGATPAAAEPDY